MFSTIFIINFWKQENNINFSKNKAVFLSNGTHLYNN